MTEYDIMCKLLVRAGYEVSEVFSDDETDEQVLYRWVVGDRVGKPFDDEEKAWLNAYEDMILVGNED